MNTYKYYNDLFATEESELILFCSIDIVGSTAMKQHLPLILEMSDKTQDGFKKFKERDSWMGLWAILYKELPESILKEDKNVRVWKYSGDEIILKRKINDFSDVNDILKIISDVVKKSRHKFLTVGSDLKVTAWTGGFPVINKKIILQKDDDNFVHDYIGPSIDIGFRLSKLSTSYKFGVSVEIAYILANLQEKIRNEDKNTFDENIEIKLYYDKNVELKGVLGGIPYPFFWIDMADHTEYERRKLKGENKSIEYKIIKQYVQSFIEEKINNPYLITVPYIRKENNEDEIYDNTNIPFKHREYWKYLKEEKNKADEAAKKETTEKIDGENIRKNLKN